ncbi:hypothetical protein CEXT_388321 [Caerostris extrusa]|uniref:Uncharacterized protein n=1 Tax=Caerostris extrusa TaxID=172846 RepID=A0AAV4XUG6_CAEEX|nr:hypothetical protein CEXT_388321 [Caerostris extrusa]
MPPANTSGKLNAMLLMLIWNFSNEGKTAASRLLVEWRLWKGWWSSLSCLGRRDLDNGKDVVEEKLPHHAYWLSGDCGKRVEVHSPVWEGEIWTMGKDVVEWKD